MPLIEKTELAGETKIGIWKLEEDADYFISKLKLSKEEKRTLDKLLSGKRYLQWLGSRVLIKELLETDEYVELMSDEQGKPVFQTLPYYLSITHSDEYAGVIISKEFQVGIDIEKIHPKIERIAHRFMNIEDMDTLSFEYEVEQMYVYWCAKEALYKLYGKRQLNFKNHIFIEPFDYMHYGQIKGKIIKDAFNKSYAIAYEKLNDYMMAYVVDGDKD